MNTVGKNKVIWSEEETARLRVAMAIPNRAKRAVAFQEFALAGNRTIWSVRCKVWALKQEADLEKLRLAKLAEAPPKKPASITTPPAPRSFEPIRQLTKAELMRGRA